MNLKINSYYACLIAIMMLSGVYVCGAQSRSLGTIWSFRDIGLSYDKKIDETNYLDFSLSANISEIFMSKSFNSGVTGSFTWNFIIKELVSDNGNPINIIAGPGVLLGYAADVGSTFGMVFGLKGKVGVECLFHGRRTKISASLNPVLGSHITMLDGMVKMNVYKWGLMGGIIPEIGLKYMF